MDLVALSDERRIAEAIAEAERKTSGEIVAVVTGESSAYLYAPIVCAAISALLVPWPLIYFTWWPVQWIYFLQLSIFVVLLAATFPRSVRHKLVPASVKRSRAHRRAVEIFLSQNLHTTSGHTGVLIYVSVAERYVEIIADSGIEARVPKGTWQAIVDDLTRRISERRIADGLVAAIETAGSHLAKHFPPGSVDTDELPNHLIILN